MSEIQSPPEPDWGAPAEVPPKPRMRRPWVIALIAGFALLCLISGACMFSCNFLFKQGKIEGAKQMTAVLQSAAARHPRASAYEKELATLNDLIEKNEVELMAIGALSSRLQHAQKDGQIDAFELEQLMGIVRHINQNKGEFKEGSRAPAKPTNP